LKLQAFSHLEALSSSRSSGDGGEKKEAKLGGEYEFKIRRKGVR
jgi:hypothetical protein